MPSRSTITVPRYVYGLAPYDWITSGSDPHWRAPLGTVGGVDLRTLTEQGTQGPTASGFVFSASLQAGAGVVLSQAWHLGLEAATTRMRDAWQTEVGYRPSGTTLLDLLWDQLTTGADPTGQAAMKPLMPNSQSVLELHLSGHSLVRREPFQWGDAHTNRVQAVLHEDFRRCFERDQVHACRVLDFWCEQFKVQDWKEFVPRNLHAHVPGRLKHQTTFTESWPTNSTTISSGQDQPWTEHSGDFEVSGNVLRLATAGARKYATCGTNLSSANHKHTATATAAETEACPDVGVRAVLGTGSDVTTGYFVRGYREVGFYFRTLNKIIDSTITVLATNSTDPGASFTLICQADGSSISGTIGSVSHGPVTDTGITGNTTVGVRLLRNSATATDATLDNHTAEDLAAAAVFHRRRTYQQAVNRASYW